MLFLVVAGLSGGALAAGSVTPQSTAPPVDATATDPSGPGFGAPSVPGADNTVTRIVLYDNGSASWEVQIRTRLATSEDETAYDSFQDAFEEAEYVEQFASNISEAVVAAEAATGRSMQAESFDASTSIQPAPRRWGVLTYSFRWDGFARQDGGTVVMGDVFEGGFYLADNDTLVVEAPPGATITSVEPPGEQRDQVVTWTGEQVFVDGRPRVVAEQTDRSGPPVVLAAVAVLLVVGAVIVVRRRDSSADAAVDAESSGGSSSIEPADGDATGQAVSAGETPQNATDEQSVEGQTDAPDEPLTDEQGRVLSDTERVEVLLGEHDGQLHQSEIRDELDWSSSKTSRVLSKMVDAETIRKVKIGRQNVVELSTDQPEGDDPADRGPTGR
jgi:hypothetical protein